MKTTLSSTRSRATHRGCRTSIGGRLNRTAYYLLGKVISILDFHKLTFDYSLDGDVKLWDLHNSIKARDTWQPSPQGLSAFDVHPIADVWAS